MVVLSGNPLDWYLVAAIAVILLGLVILSIRSYDPSFGGYYWGTLVILGLIMVVFIGNPPYNYICAALSAVIIGLFLRGHAFLTLFSLEPESLYIHKDTTVWDQPVPSVETNQVDQDPTMEEPAV